jgi:hypothetical protein
MARFGPRKSAQSRQQTATVAEAEGQGQHDRGHVRGPLLAHAALPGVPGFLPPLPDAAMARAIWLGVGGVGGLLFVEATDPGSETTHQNHICSL